jgi:hypothetical protein
VRVVRGVVARGVVVRVAYRMGVDVRSYQDGLTSYQRTIYTRMGSDVLAPTRMGWFLVDAVRDGVTAKRGPRRAGEGLWPCVPSHESRALRATGGVWGGAWMPSPL